MQNSEEKNKVLGGMLYLVATPVGNLSDLSPRAVKILSEVDFVAAEDTRNTGLLLSRLGLRKELISYFEHNKRERGPKIVERLERGESCALVTDAGTPAISDPGEDIVRLCADRNIAVTAVPGACAAILALTLSAISTSRFVFEGFLPIAKGERRERLDMLSKERRTVIVYEAPHRLCSTLAELKHTLGGERKITLCRELTKLNEELMRTTLADAVLAYEKREPRGEYVLVIEGAKEKSEVDYPDNVVEHVKLLISDGLDKMTAMKNVAKVRGVSKSEIYKMYLEGQSYDTDGDL